MFYVQTFHVRSILHFALQPVNWIQRLVIRNRRFLVVTFNVQSMQIADIARVVALICNNPQGFYLILK